MATATLMSPAPTGPYYSHHSSFNSPSLPHPNTTASTTNSSTTPSIAGMISPLESRRMSDEMHDSQPHRQSLPSINDVLSIAKPSFPPPALQTSLPGPPAPLPSPFGNAPTRPFPERASSAEKDASPRTLHPPTDSPFRPRPAPLALNTYGSHQPSPTSRHDHGPPESDSRPPEPSAMSNGYPGAPPPPPPPPPQQHAHYPPAPGPLPPSQYPLPGPYPVSPRNPGMPPHPYEARGPYMQPPPPQDDYNQQRYDSAITRGYDFYHMLDYLQRVGSSSRTINSFSNHWAPIIREHHGNQAIPARLPRLQEISEMINNAELLKNSLGNIRELVQQNLNMAEAERRGLEMAGGPKGKAVDEAETKSFYGAQPPEQVKKRRGRAAPPGRCHSCNRSDTPEWRRGPDGARTLCNACGLHFAKLNKKRQQDNARSLRPKPEPENP
ncbi:hypothetical protein MKZ38_007947 [Zalerion maritima]|uniref:GATA-type domain-containing protein n=1 Tax=Zalerion maritima TaxID=339359 RepID=A0AAD5RVC7_9PEZI|nr:hypothetical protein MKZ38_007947 [Zalerion maritima]